MQKKILISAFLGLFVLLGSLGVISYMAVNDSIQRSLASHLYLANIVGKYFDELLADSLSRLSYIAFSGSIDFEDDNWEPEKKALRSVHQYSFFTDLIFFLDRQGNVILSYPDQGKTQLSFSGIPAVQEVLRDRASKISNVYTIESTEERVIFALVPLINPQGEFIGIVGGKINPHRFLVTEILKSISVGDGTLIELVDSNGLIIASNDPERILTSSDHDKYLSSLITSKRSAVGRCHRCHTQEAVVEQGRDKDMLAFAPIEAAPWGVSVREPEAVVFAPALHLKKWFLILSVVSAAVGLVLALHFSRNFVRPVQLLIAATKKIGRGDLSGPVLISSHDEIEILARSFDDMRKRLAVSLDQIRQANIELENRVAARTQDLEQSRRKLSNLLLKLITAEEEDRKRIAKTLHDDTGQPLNAVMFSLDFLCAAAEGNTVVQEKAKQLRQQMSQTVNGIWHLIEDLHPTLLDELGLEPAIQWLVERHLLPRGIHTQLSVLGNCRTAQGDGQHLPDCTKRELVLFRLLQEALTNIGRHANAHEVEVSVIFHAAFVEVEVIDDGQGFDVVQVFDPRRDEKDMSCYGLLAMQERITLLDGKIAICSRPNQGAQISFFLPL